jgi:hypothetical protein
MAYTLKASGIATNLTFCFAIDSDGTTPKEFVSSDVDTNKTYDTGVLASVAAATWKSVSRGYLVTTSNGAFDFNGVRFASGHRPSMDTSGSSSCFFACNGASAGSTVKTFFGDDSTNSYVARNSTDKGVLVVGARTAGNAGTTSLPTDGTTKFSFGVSNDNASAGKVYYYGLESGSLAADGGTTGDNGFGSNVNIHAIGGAAGQGNQPFKPFICARFNRVLTLTEFQSLHDDWFGTLFDSGALAPRIVTAVSSVSLF